MPENFGARLRQRREERGIDLITIAKQTKIKPTLLDALERGDVSEWPSGFYRRAFIRTYAHAIDLDPDVVLREFLEVHPEPPEVDVVAAMASTLGLGDKSTRPATTRVRNAVELAIGSLSRMRRSEVDVPVAAPAAPVPTLPPPTQTAPPVVTNAAVVEPTREILPDLPDPPPVPQPPSSEADLLAVANLCTELARAGSLHDVQPLMPQAAKLLDATGLIVWLWDASVAALTPALVHGYSPRTIAQLPAVRRDADNATALGFRLARVCEIAGTEQVSGALVVPLLTTGGCIGVLAVELPRGSGQTPSAGALAAILAALLAQITLNFASAQTERLAAAGASLY